MRHLRADEALQFVPLGLERLGHDFAGRALRVDLAAVGDERDVEQVADVVRHVVLAPELLLVPGGVLLGLEVPVAGDVDEPRARVGRGEVVGVVGGQVPGAGAAHAEAHQHDAVGVDLVAMLDRRDRVEHVGLAGRLEAEALAAEGVQDDRPFGRDLPLVRLAAADEVEVGVGVAPPVEPDVERDGLGEVDVVGDFQPVRLR